MSDNIVEHCENDTDEFTIENDIIIIIIVYYVGQMSPSFVISRTQCVFSSEVSWSRIQKNPTQYVYIPIGTPKGWKTCVYNKILYV